MPSPVPTRATARALPAWLSYLVAVAIGCWAASSVFPLADLAGRLAPGLPQAADPLQHLAGQLSFLAEPWHWPLFEVHRLDAPHGVNIALTDSIPLAAVLLKLLHPMLPGVQQGIGPWLGAAWVLQPVAAVYALRGTGERGLVASVAVAAIASTMPTFLIRTGHAALDGHFVLLLALGLCLRAVRPGAGAAPVVLLAALVVLSLFIHPYLMAMVAGVAVAAPATLAARSLPGRRRRRSPWRPAAIAAASVGLGLVAAAALAKLFGYLGGGVPRDYGLYSMNLAAPFWPAPSRLLPGIPVNAVNATGGQIFEGFQYLGAGALLLLLAAVARRRGRAWLVGCAPRHAGLLGTCVVLSAYAVSTHVYLFHVSLLHLRAIPPAGRIFRASGRLFWPVAYTLVLAGVRGTALAWPRGGATMLLAAAGLQLFDTSTLRTHVHDEQLIAWQPEDATAAAVDGAMGHYRSVTLVPRLECDASDIDAAMPLIFLAARHGLPVNTMYAARIEVGNLCGPVPGADGRRPLDAGALAIAYGPTRAAQGRRWRTSGATCLDLDGLTLCAADGAGLAMLAPTSPGATLAPGETVTAAHLQLFSDMLAAGWGAIEPWGAWAVVPDPELRLAVAQVAGPVAVTLGLQTPPGVVAREVRVRAGGAAGRVVATWTVDRQHRTARFVLAPGEARLADGQAISLTLDAGPTVTLPGVPRRFGVGLLSVEVAPAL